MEDISEKLIAKFTARQANIGVVGLGYVGLPLSIAFAENGFRVIGFDPDRVKVRHVNSSTRYINHIPATEIKSISRQGGSATYNHLDLAEADAIIVCVPTPLTKNRDPDTSYVAAAAQTIASILHPGQLVVLESTAYPGITRDVFLPELEKSKLRGGQDFLLAYSPEREDPGVNGHSASSIPKVVAGLTDACLKAAEALYITIVPKIVPVSSLETAEATKLMENIFRCVNIAMVNELKQVFSRMNIDIWEVIEAAQTKPFGFMPFHPGPGLGGHCIPIDPFYLTWKARGYECATRFIELAGEINTAMPEYVVSRVAEELNSFQKPLNGSKILLLGMAYKKNIDDVRESPSFRLLELFNRSGA
ncbi:MAG: nucleotide sugar dehydrogenase, partial [Planctomycetota bacterium]|nr:nucleotide sugar dehydrogenase [Planctomycetota bacterium]